MVSIEPRVIKVDNVEKMHDTLFGDKDKVRECQVWAFVVRLSEISLVLNDSIQSPVAVSIIELDVGDPLTKHA